MTWDLQFDSKPSICNVHVFELIVVYTKYCSHVLWKENYVVLQQDYGCQLCRPGFRLVGWIVGTWIRAMYIFLSTALTITLTWFIWPIYLTFNKRVPKQPKPEYLNIRLLFLEDSQNTHKFNGQLNNYTNLNCISIHGN